MEDRTWRREFRSAQDACCLCLNTFKLTSMEDNFYFNMKTQTYSQIMEICLSIQISDDCMLCGDCAERLKQLWIFFSLIHITQAALRGIITTRTVKDEPKEINHHEETLDSFVKEEIMLEDGTTDCDDVFITEFEKPAPCKMEINAKPPQLNNGSIPIKISINDATVTVKHELKKVNHHEENSDIFIKDEILLKNSILNYDDVFITNEFEKFVIPAPCKLEINTEFKEQPQLKNELIPTNVANNDATVAVKDEPKKVNHHEESLDSFIEDQIMLEGDTLNCGDVSITNECEISVTPTLCKMEINTEFTKPQLKNELIPTNIASIDALATVKDELNDMNHQEESSDSFIKQEIMLEDGTPYSGDVFISNSFEKSVGPAPCKLEITNKSTEPPQSNNGLISMNVTTKDMSNKTASSMEPKDIDLFSAMEEKCFFTMSNDKCTCIICYAIEDLPSESNCKRHFRKFHKEYEKIYPFGSSLRKAKIQKLMTFINIQPSLLAETATMETFQKTTESEKEVPSEASVLSQLQNITAMGVNRNPLHTIKSTITDVRPSSPLDIGPHNKRFPRLAPAPKIQSSARPLTLRLCLNCKKIGHISDRCPKKTVSPIQLCLNCQRIGHIADQCPNMIQQPLQLCLEKIPPPLPVCTNCQGMGHISNQCPITIRPNRCPPHLQLCLNCQKTGHIYGQCPNKVPQTILVCSKCKEIGHIFNQCPGKIKPSAPASKPDLLDLATEKVDACPELETNIASKGPPLVQPIRNHPGRFTVTVMKNSIKRKSLYYDAEWEEEFFITLFKNRHLCIICHSYIKYSHRSYILRHYTTHHKEYDNSHPLGTELRKTLVEELMTKLINPLKPLNIKGESTISGPASKEMIDMASLEIIEHLSKHKKPSADGEIWKETFIKIGELLFEDFDNKSEIMASIKEMSLSKNTSNHKDDDE